jgi:hypothetical protein
MDTRKRIYVDGYRRRWRRLMLTPLQGVYVRTTVGFALRTDGFALAYGLRTTVGFALTTSHFALP